MKTIIKPFGLLATLFFVGWLNAGCNQRSSTSEASPQGTCRIQQYTATSKSRFSNTVSQTTYSYDPAGNLTNVVSTLDKRPINGSSGTQTSTKTDTYAYNAEGYLTGSTSQWRTVTTLNDQPKDESLSTVKSYSYTSGRLSRTSETHTGTYSSSVSPSITAYEYDSNGNLTRVTETSDNNATQQIWVYLNNQFTDYVEKSGPSETRSFTVTSGLVQSYRSNGYKTVWEYDSQQRQTKIANYHGDTLTRVTNQIWSDARPATASLPLFKGFPVTGPSFIFGRDGVLATQQQLYWNSISKTMNPFNEDTYSVQTNEQGFITGATIVSKHPLAADQDYITTEVYTYAGCQ